jgi:hypothetical protein
MAKYLLNYLNVFLWYKTKKNLKEMFFEYLIIDLTVIGGFILGRILLSLGLLTVFKFAGSLC